MRTEAAAREGRGFFSFCFGARAIEALIQFNGKSSVEALDPPAWSAQELPQLGRTAPGNCALLQETSPSADEKLIGKC